MINIKKINEISLSDEGKILIAALSILTTIDSNGQEKEKWGGLLHPDDALKKVVELANKIFYAEEWESEKISKERDLKLNKILL